MRKLIYLLVVVLLSGCSSLNQDSAPSYSPDVSKIPDAVPQPVNKSKYGNPASYVVFGKRYYVKNSASNYTKTGIASWYGTKFHERRTSSGEPYNMYAMTAAHKTLPLPTYARVTNLENGRSIVVKINDRGPFHENRIIDLSYVAAQKLDMMKTGTAPVRVDAIDSNHAENNKAPIFAPTKATHPRLFLQIGAYSTRFNANRMQTRLHEETTLPAIVNATTKNGSPLYRVQIGPLENVEEADRLTEKLKQDGLGRAYVVVAG